MEAFWPEGVWTRSDYACGLERLCGNLADFRPSHSITHCAFIQGRFRYPKEDLPKIRKPMLVVQTDRLIRQ
jgi:hypothetical protein